VQPPQTATGRTQGADAGRDEGRDAKGDADYILILSTPDCRRLLTPATHQPSPFMGVAGQRTAVNTVGEGDADMHGEF